MFLNEINIKANNFKVWENKSKFIDSLTETRRSNDIPSQVHKILSHSQVDTERNITVY